MAWRAFSFSWLNTGWIIHGHPTDNQAECESHFTRLLLHSCKAFLSSPMKTEPIDSDAAIQSNEEGEALGNLVGFISGTNEWEKLGPQVDFMEIIHRWDRLRAKRKTLEVAISHWKAVCQGRETDMKKDLDLSRETWCKMNHQNFRHSNNLRLFWDLELKLVWKSGRVRVSSINVGQQARISSCGKLPLSSNWSPTYLWYTIPMLH